MRMGGTRRWRHQDDDEWLDDDSSNDDGTHQVQVKFYSFADDFITLSATSCNSSSFLSSSPPGDDNDILIKTDGNKKKYKNELLTDKSGPAVVVSVPEKAATVVSLNSEEGEEVIATKAPVDISNDNDDDEQDDDDFSVSSQESMVSSCSESSISLSVASADSESESESEPLMELNTNRNANTDGIERAINNTSKASPEPTPAPPPVVKPMPTIPILKFDWDFTTSCIAVVILYSFAHNSIYQVIYHILSNSIVETEYARAIDVCLFFIGIFLMRITGGLFYFLNDQKQRSLKIELQNRRKHISKLRKSYHKYNILTKFKLNILHYDDCSLKWFKYKRNELIRTFIEVLGFYLCFIAIDSCNYNLASSIGNITQDIMNGLPSAHDPNLYGSSLIGLRLQMNEMGILPNQDVYMMPPSSTSGTCGQFQEEEEEEGEKQQNNLTDFSDNDMTTETQLDVMEGEIGQNQRECHEKDDEVEMAWPSMDSEASIQDDLYLYEKLSKLSYAEYMRDQSHEFLDIRKTVLFYFTSASGCVWFLMRQFKVGIWD